jgi:hypothetical protein
MEKFGQGKQLRYALARNATRGAQIGCTLFLGVLLSAIGGGVLYAAWRNNDTSLVLKIVGGAFAFFGVLLLLSAIHQTFALRTPLTIVETDSDVFQRGKHVRLYFRQPGPGSFESLRANLVGQESWHTGSGKRRQRHVHNLGTFHVFDSGAFEVLDHDFQRSVTFQVPDLPRAAHGRMETWTLEVWGKVNGRADFQHVFPVNVR